MKRGCVIHTFFPSCWRWRSGWTSRERTRSGFHSRHHRTRLQTEEKQTAWCECNSVEMELAQLVVVLSWRAFPQHQDQDIWLVAGACNRSFAPFFGLITRDCRLDQWRPADRQSGLRPSGQIIAQEAHHASREAKKSGELILRRRCHVQPLSSTSRHFRGFHRDLD